MGACLSPGDLERLRAGKLDGGTTTTAREHIRDCANCKERLDATTEVCGPLSGSQEADADVTQTSDTSVPAPQLGALCREEEYPDIEGYEIQGVLGRGGMGIVYRAVQKNLKRTVALKVMPSIIGSSNPNAVARFRREATSAARLHHTNIIPVYDSGEMPHALYYAMELIEGKTLEDLIRDQADTYAAASPTRFGNRVHFASAMSASGTTGTADTTVSPQSTAGGSGARAARSYYQQVARWIRDAADALAYAHESGIIHRDIKPANLIVSLDGRIMIADFGLAKSEDEPTVTQEGSFLGTLRYASPEQARGIILDHRSDVYSLGATMYELLCFRPAHPGFSKEEVLNTLLNNDPARPRRVVPAVPAELETICLKAMDRESPKRYQSAGDLADDLRRFLNDLPIVAKRPSLIRRAYKFVKRHKLLATVATAVMLIAGSSALMVHAQAQRRQAEAERHVAQTESRFESGMYWAGEEKWDRAEREFQRALALDADNVRSLLAMVWMNLERFKGKPGLATVEALERLDGLCRRVLTMQPDELTALSYRSVVLKKLERYDEAIRATERVIELQPDYFAAWSNLGAYYAIAGRLDLAVEKLSRGAELADGTDEGRLSDQAGVFRNLAAAELYINEPAAFEHINRALHANPHDVAGWALRVRLRLSLTGYVDVAEALDDAKHADRLAMATNGRVKRLRAEAHLANREYEAAALHAHKALELGGLPAACQYILAAANAGRGDTETAQRHILAALEAWPATLESKPYVATFDEGVLWFESAAALQVLRAAAESANRSP